MKTLGNTYPVHPGTAFVFSPHQKVSAEAVPNQRFRNFACRFMPENGRGQELRDQAEKLMGVMTSDLVRIKELCRAAVHSSHFKDALAVQQSSGLCFQILAQIWRDAHTPSSRDPDTAILRLMETLREQPSQRLSLEEMAEEARLSVAQFSRRFIALAGEPPMHFAIRQRITHAEYLLQDYSMPVSEVAEALGYTDIYFFSRQFKKVTSMSPSAYRKKASDNRIL